LIELVFVDWPIDVKGGSLAGDGFDGDVAIVLLDDAVDGGEAEAGAFTDGFRGEEGFEDMFDGIGIYSDAAIGDRELDMRAAGGLEEPGGYMEESGAREFGRCVDGIPCVDEEVDDDLVELGAVGEDGSGSGGGGELELDIFSYEAPVDTERAFDLFVHIERDGADDLLPAEHEELLSEGPGAVGGLEDFLDLVFLGFVEVGVLVEEFGVSLDDREQVIEVVGDAAGEAADRLHFGGLEELRAELVLFFFGFAAVGEVLEDAELAGGVAELDFGYADFDWYGLAVGLEDFAFADDESAFEAVLAFGGEDMVQGASHHVTVALVGHVTEGLVAVDDALGGCIDEGHPFCAALEEVAVALFTFAEGGVGVVEFGELGGDVVTCLECFPYNVEVIRVSFDTGQGELVEGFEEDLFLERDCGEKGSPVIGVTGADEAKDEGSEGFGVDLQLAGVIEEEGIRLDGFPDV
jgi:hypothetical protein